MCLCSYIKKFLLFFFPLFSIEIKKRKTKKLLKSYGFDFLLANIEFNMKQMMFDINSGNITFVRMQG